MKIEYELSEVDILALMQFRLQRSRGRRNPVFVRRLSYFVGFALMAFGTWLLFHDYVLIIVFLALAIVSLLFYPVIFICLLRRKVAGTYRDPMKRATLASRTLRVNNEGLQEMSGMGETKVKWDVITDLAETPTHAFITMLNDSAIIVPKDRLANDDFQSFLNVCREHINKSAT